MTEEYLFKSIREELRRAATDKYTGEKTFKLTFNSGGLTRGRITSDQVIQEPGDARSARPGAIID